MHSATAVSRIQDSAEAIREAHRLAMERIGDRDHIFAAMVFFGAEYDPEPLASTLATLLPGVSIVGCSTDGEITADGLSVDSVVLILLSSPSMTARAAHFAGLTPENSLQAGREIASSLASERGRALMLFPDGLTCNGSDIIRGAQEVLNSSFIMAGGTSGDRGRFQKTFQIQNGKAHSTSLVGLMLESDTPLEIGFGVMSGWKPIGIAKTVTHAEGNVVYRIENETALDVYSTFLGDKASQLPAIGVEYPFGLVDESGRVGEKGFRDGDEYILLRAPMAVDRSTGAIQFAASIPQGAKIKMTRAKSTEIIEAAREAASRSLQHLTGKPDAVFFFSCMARKVVLGRKTDQEIMAAREVYGESIPMIGFYTYGEIANCGENAPICRFHNETATFLAIRES